MDIIVAFLGKVLTKGNCVIWHWSQWYRVFSFGIGHTCKRNSDPRKQNLSIITYEESVAYKSLFMNAKFLLMNAILLHGNKKGGK